MHAFAHQLATAAIDEGHFGQAFPAFGAERRGAPLVSFVPIAERSLLRRKLDELLRFLHNPHNENESSRLESVHASPTHRLSLVHWNNPIPGGS